MVGVIFFISKIAGAIKQVFGFSRGYEGAPGGQLSFGELRGASGELRGASGTRIFMENHTKIIGNL